MNTRICEFVVAFLIRGVIRLLRLLPHHLLRVLLTAVACLCLSAVPKFRRISMVNLRIAFPEMDESERLCIYKRSQGAIARMVADAIRLPDIDKKWVHEHVEFPRLEEFEALQQRHRNRGVFIATGHLGSFELLGRATALYGYPLSFVVRDFKNRSLNGWWRSIRELDGNRMISREGAYREMIRDLKRNRNVAVLFDQNVTRNLAVFVPLFGKLAATTRAFGLAALQARPVVVVAALKYVGAEKYRVMWVESDMDDVYEADWSRERKVEEITSRITGEYEKMIREYPEGWFWMHRRWRTTASDEISSVYESASQRELSA